MPKPPTRHDLPIDVYTRVSRLSDTRMRSTDGQALDCTLRIQDVGRRVGETFVDPGKSAWNPRVKRTDWARLMVRLESGLSGGVCVFDLARFSRRPIEGERLILAADQGLLVLDSEGDYDLTSASGKKAFRDQMNAAAYESDRLSTRVARGKRIKALNGESNISHRPFGFEPDGITPREPEFAELAGLLQRLLDKEDASAIVADLKQRGVVTVDGHDFTLISLRQIAIRPRNAGLASLAGEVLGQLKRGENVPTAITREQHEEVILLYAARKRGRAPSGRYILTGEIHCGLCGTGMGGGAAKGLRPYPDGEVRRLYRCPPRGCSKVYGDMRQVDLHVRGLVAGILADPEHSAAIEARAAAAAQKRGRLDEDVRDLERIAIELADRLGQGTMTLDRYDAAMIPLQRRLDALRAEAAKLGTALRPVELTPEERDASASEWKARWDAATVPQKRQLLRRALRGKRLILMPHPAGAPRTFQASRLRIAD